MVRLPTDSRMSESMFDDDELFAEAAEELQVDVDDALTRAREHVPAEEVVLGADQDELQAVLASLTTTLDIEAIKDALQEARKAFVMGRRADAFDDEYIADTEATMTTLEDTVTTLQNIEAAATDLTEALTTFEDLDATEIESTSATAEAETVAETDMTDENILETEEPVENGSDTDTEAETDSADLTETPDE